MEYSLIEMGDSRGKSFLRFDEAENVMRTSKPNVTDNENNKTLNRLFRSTDNDLQISDRLNESLSESINNHDESIYRK
jgi:hypothetical protein